MEMWVNSLQQLFPFGESVCRPLIAGLAPWPQRGKLLFLKHFLDNGGNRLEGFVQLFGLGAASLSKVFALKTSSELLCYLAQEFHILGQHGIAVGTGLFGVSKPERDEVFWLSLAKIPSAVQFI